MKKAIVLSAPAALTSGGHETRLGKNTARAPGAHMVALERQGDQWVLLRGGEPYEIHGAGVDGTDFDALAARGGNSLRTWAADIPGRSAQTVLDEGFKN